MNVHEKIISIASSYTHNRQGPLALSPQLLPALLSVSAPIGADVGMAWIYNSVQLATEKLGIVNPLLASPWPYEQWRHCLKHSYKGTTPFYKTSKALVTIDFSNVSPENINHMVRKGDIFLIQIEDGHYKCGIVIETKLSDFITIEPGIYNFENKRRLYKCINHIIRIC